MKVAITGKGGVGKTTLASTLARLYADEGRTVLAADVDPDANLGLALGLSQEEVDAILAQPADQITEIAPYDNATVVIAQLNGILSASEEYTLTFRDVEINDDGTVRRIINMNFRCTDYASARRIVDALSSSHWRCIVNSVNMSVPKKEIERDDVPNIMKYPVEVTAQVTFFESKNLA